MVGPKAEPEIQKFSVTIQSTLNPILGLCLWLKQKWLGKNYQI
jgi:hypothetical protein